MKLEALEAAARSLAEHAINQDPNWPRDAEGEPIDLENLRVVRLTIVVGGDWQESHAIRFDEEGRVREVTFP